MGRGRRPLPRGIILEARTSFNYKLETKRFFGAVVKMNTITYCLYREIDEKNLRLFLQKKFHMKILFLPCINSCIFVYIFPHFCIYFCGKSFSYFPGQIASLCGSKCRKEFFTSGCMLCPKDAVLRAAAADGFLFLLSGWQIVPCAKIQIPPLSQRIEASFFT